LSLLFLFKLIVYFFPSFINNFLFYSDTLDVFPLSFEDNCLLFINIVLIIFDFNYSFLLTFTYLLLKHNFIDVGLTILFDIFALRALNNVQDNKLSLGLLIT
jgi:hypothetical protein